MAQAIIYCDRCGKIIPPSEIPRGTAIVSGEVGICPQCVQNLPADERDALRRRVSGEVEPARQRRAGSAATGRTPQRASPGRSTSTRTTRRGGVEGAPAKGGRTGMGIAVAGIAAGALAGIAFALMRGRGDGQPTPRPEPEAAAPAEPESAPEPPADAPELPRADPAEASKRFAEIKRTFDASFRDYARGRKVLREFLKGFPDAPEAEEVKALLAEMGGEDMKDAEEALAFAVKRAETLASQGKYDKVAGAFEPVRKTFSDTEWLETEGEKKIAEALRKIEEARASATKAALARARSAFDSKDFGGARAALGARSGWPEDVRKEAESLLEEVRMAEAELKKEQERRETWKSFLVDLQDAGRRSVAEAEGVVRRRRSALREAGFGKRAERFSSLVREAKLIDELAAMALAASKKPIRLRVKGRPVGGKVIGFEGGVLRLQPVHGGPVDVRLADVGAEDIVAVSGAGRAEGGDPLRAATYLLVRGRLDAARKLIAALASDKAFALGDDIDEVARLAPPPPEPKPAAPGETVPADPLMRGLLGYWKLDGTFGKRVTDSSGKGCHGTIFGARRTMGKTGRGLSFSGNEAHVKLPSGFEDFTRGLTIALWARPDAVRRWARFVELGNGRERDNIVFARRDRTNDLCFHMYTGTKGGKHVAAGGIIELGKWQHFAASCDGSGNVVLYKNGERAGSGRTKVPTKVERIFCRLGISSWPNDEAYKGRMDEVRVYKRALSAKEIRAVFEGRSLSVPPGTSGPTRGPTRGLVAHWEFDEENGTKAADSSGKGRHGAVKGGAKWVEGKLGGALGFDGKDDFVEVPHHSSINPTGAVTVAAWAMSGTSKWNESGFLVSKRDSYILHPDKGSKTVKFYVFAGGWRNAAFTPAVDITRWHHYAGTYDGGTVRLYIDGRKVASTAYRGSIKADTGRLCIGWDEGQSGRRFKGSMDEVRIYDRALGAQEVKELADLRN